MVNKPYSSYLLNNHQYIHTANAHLLFIGREPTHAYSNPEHNKGGTTSDGPMAFRSFDWQNNGGGRREQTRDHLHAIATDYTHITISNSGIHSLKFDEPGAIETNEQVEIMQPYETVNYII
ncbi:unnamed protein product [Didymodactylos carnosus]|uniref:Uncharacterized protein n=1 Tax=Didymodactylos carnosus TaxID=1234261 RepID=A0A814ZC41_9BILA|nr:unnamed protein product [Didymodactylos carnosus]CAF1510172.1 unnamed protein product [Didymodactylos carnosus]CAF4005278.1 unnamed protein product [Didymodactylos carnosus]CAF4298054.1 unnamed protein product [Didymodactylos carnosus]